MPRVKIPQIEGLWEEKNQFRCCQVSSAYWKAIFRATPAGPLLPPVQQSQQHTMEEMAPQAKSFSVGLKGSSQVLHLGFQHSWLLTRAALELCNPPRKPQGMDNSTGLLSDVSNSHLEGSLLDSLFRWWSQTQTSSAWPQKGLQKAILEQAENHGIMGWKRP